VTRAWVGISGWRYPHWRGVFYPEGLRQKDELVYASRSMDSIEVNGSFYGLLHASAVARWYEESPEGFTFAVKGSRFITHMKRLSDPKPSLANFFAAGVLAFEDKLGPVLWQLPPSFQFDRERIESFLRLLPRTTKAASKLARTHDARVKDPRVVTHADRPIRYALEVRHGSFDCPECYELLRQHDVSLCIADTAKVHPDFDAITASFVYVRLHGAEKLYESGYTKRQLQKWAVRVSTWCKEGRDVYVYFDNDARVRAPFDARCLRSLLDGTRPKRTPSLAKAGEPARTSWPAWTSTRP